MPNPTFTDKDIVFGRTVVPVVNQNKLPKKDKIGFEYAEHCFIGDSIKLRFPNENPVAASDHPFVLKNLLSVTYGQINALAGDFYGTTDPISDGADDEDRSSRFTRAYNTLAGVSSRQPQEAKDILALLQTEVDAVNKALKNHQDPSIAYSKLPDVSVELQAKTLLRPSDQPSYLGLSLINWDHFGEDARTAYNAGHSTAIQEAIKGDLNLAYTMNAFADHFLEDSFSAGHLRTPRRRLHGSMLNPAPDACAKFMHDEDNAIGLSVKNPSGQSWTIYGDKRALDEVDDDNEKRCIEAVQASADEVYEAYTTKTAPSPSTYKAWTIAPTLNSANAPQTLTNLCTFKDERREAIMDRRSKELITDWTFIGTASKCELSGWWDYPITIDGPKIVLHWTATAACSNNDSGAHVFYQGQDSFVRVNNNIGGTWPRGSRIFKAVRFTPLAAVSWKGFDEIRVYYLNEEYILQEFCYTYGRGWYRGDIGQLKIKANYNSAIAAVIWTDETDHIRVYCQEHGSNSIEEFSYDGSWSKSGSLASNDVLSGSSLAAVVFVEDSTSGARLLRLYYQAEDLSLKEYCHDGSEWSPGAFNPGQQPGCTPISAFGFAGSSCGYELQVFWRNLNNGVARSIYQDSCWVTPRTLELSLTPGTDFSVIQWNDGDRIRIYHQKKEDFITSINEHCYDDNQSSPGDILEKY